jgi:hypothetical protein
VLWLLGGLALVALFVWASLRYLDDARPHLGWAIVALAALALLAVGAVLPTPAPAPASDSPYTALFEALYEWRSAAAQPLSSTETALMVEALSRREAAGGTVPEVCTPRPNGGGPGYGYRPSASARVCWQWAGANGAGTIDLSALPWGMTGNAWSYAAPMFPERVPLRYAGKPLGGHFCGDDLERINFTLDALCAACARGDFGAGVNCAAGPTWMEVADWAATHPRTGGGTGGSTDDRCPGGLWHECPPPRLPCDEYFPPSASRPYCYTLAGSAQRLRCSDVPACRPGGQPQPEPEPEPPGGPEPEPPGEPGERSVCESVLHVAVELGCGVLSPLPPCPDGEWIFECRAVAP